MREATDKALHERVKEVFLAVQALPRSQWEATLDRECAGDAVLREESLRPGRRVLRPHALRLTAVPGPPPRRLRGQGGWPVPVDAAARPRRHGGGLPRAASAVAPACAVKLIRPEQAVSEDWLRRFEREVQATAQLTHPNTVEVYDFGRTDDGSFFCAMEYLPGTTLDAHGARAAPWRAARRPRRHLQPRRRRLLPPDRPVPLRARHGATACANQWNSAQAEAWWRAHPPPAEPEAAAEPVDTAA